jgi:methionyl-tRNA synthetase
MCTKLLDPKDLKNQRSALTGSTNLEFRKTKHLYLKLSVLQGEIREWVDRRDWNKLTKGIAYKWLDEGLADRSITRDLKWGVPVPQDVWPDMAGKVFYVWFDAPVGYISMTKDAIGEDYKKWWFAGGDVKYVEFMGKDNVPFHSVFFPGMLIGAGRGYKLVDELKGLSYLNFNGGKFSKSERRGVFAEDALEEFEADYWRYWLLKNMPETDDVDFTFERFADDINKDLNDVLGNFVLRVLKFYSSKFGTEVRHAAACGELEVEILEKLEGKGGLVGRYHSHMRDMEFRKAMATLREIWALDNEYIDRTAPWRVYKTDPGRAGGILAFAMSAILGDAALALPVIPEFASRILGLFGIKPGDVDFRRGMPKARQGAKFTLPEKMFEKITPERVAELNEKYNR